MKKTVLALMIVVVVVVAGCNSRPKKNRKPVTKVVAGKNVPTREVQSIRGYEIISTYHLGRRIDPNDPNIMYEAGKMYVIRRSPTWNLRPGSLPSSRQTFKERIHPLKVKFENMKKQQDLVADRNKIAGKIGIELLKIRKNPIYCYQEWCGNGKGWSGNDPRISNLGSNIKTHKRHYVQQSEYTICRKLNPESKNYDYYSHEDAFTNNGQSFYGLEQDSIFRFILPVSEKSKVLNKLDLFR